MWPFQPPAHYSKDWKRTFSIRILTGNHRIRKLFTLTGPTDLFNTGRLLTPNSFYFFFKAFRFVEHATLHTFPMKYLKVRKCQKFNKWKRLTFYGDEQWETEAEDEKVGNYLKRHGLVEDMLRRAGGGLVPVQLPSSAWLRKKPESHSPWVPPLPLPLLQLPQKTGDLDSESSCDS